MTGSYVILAISLSRLVKHDPYGPNTPRTDPIVKFKGSTSHSHVAAPLVRAFQALRLLKTLLPAAGSAIITFLFAPLAPAAVFNGAAAAVFAFFSLLAVVVFAPFAAGLVAGVALPARAPRFTFVTMVVDVEVLECEEDVVWVLEAEVVRWGELIAAGCGGGSILPRVVVVAFSREGGRESLSVVAWAPRLACSKTP